MNTTITQREAEIRAEIADLNPRIMFGTPAHLEDRRQALSRELCRLIAARLMQKETK